MDFVGGRREWSVEPRKKSAALFLCFFGGKREQSSYSSVACVFL